MQIMSTDELSRVWLAGAQFRGQRLLGSPRPLDGCGENGSASTLLDEVSKWQRAALRCLSVSGAMIRDSYYHVVADGGDRRKRNVVYIGDRIHECGEGALGSGSWW